MSIIFVIILVFTVNLMPENTKEFSLETSPKKTIHFTKRPDGGWEAVRLPKNKPYGTYYFDGLKIKALMNQEIKIDAAKFLKINDLKELKKMDVFKLGKEEIKIDKKDSGIIFDTGKMQIKAFWKK